MKKTMMMIAVCMLSMVGVAQTTESLTIADFDIVAGEQKSVSVELTSDKAYTAFQLDIFLPEGLSIATVTLNGKEYLDADLGSDMVNSRTGHTLSVEKVVATEEAEKTGNLYRFLAFSSSNSNFLTTSGTILNLTVQADEDLPVGTLAGAIKRIRFSTSAAVETLFDESTFAITCKENTSTGIGGVTAGTQDGQVYTLDGRQVKSAQKGVNIVRQSNGTVQKVYVK